MSLQVLCPIHTLSENPNYAWELLEYQIAVQLSETAKGDDVAKLLSLYLEGVQMTNSVLDPRQSYFRCKATQLMTKPNVVRGLNKVSKKKVIQVQKQQLEKNNTFSLFAEKKKQIEMRLAYESEDNNRQILKKLLRQQANRQCSLSKTIQQIVKNHQQILHTRIKKRKLKATTSPSQSQVNQLNPKEPNYNKQGNNIFSNVTVQQREQSQLISLTMRTIKSQCSQIYQQNLQLSPRHKRRNSFNLNYFFKVQLQS